MNLKKKFQLIIWYYLAHLVCSESKKKKSNFKNELELFPHMFNISYIKESTQNYKYFRVYLKETQNKGLGVFASKRIPSNRTLMYYKLKIFSESNYQRIGDGKYSIVVLKKTNGSYMVDEDKVADIFVESNQKPKGRIPFWAYLANEPDIDQVANCDLFYFNFKDNFQIGDVYTLNLVSTREIHTGEEITWCYGKNYKRDYNTGCYYL